MNKFILGLTIFVLASCASKPFPISGPKAFLTIEAPAYDVTGFQFSTKHLEAFIANDSSGCAFESGGFKEGSLLFYAGLESKQPKTTVEIPYGKEIFMRIHDNAGIECIQGVRFKPDENAKYHLIVNTYGENSSTCSAVLYEVRGDKEIEVKSAKYAPGSNPFKKWIDYTKVCD